MGRKSGAKDMRYALLNRPPTKYQPWNERHPGYGAGALEAANTTLSNSRTCPDDEFAELTKIAERLKEVVGEKERARTQEDFDAAVLEEYNLLQRDSKVREIMDAKTKLKDAMELKKKKEEEEDSVRGLSEVQLRKKERLERRERAIAAKKAGGIQAAGSKVVGGSVSAAEGPVGVVKNVGRGRVSVAEVEKRGKVLEKALEEQNKVCKHEELFQGLCVACGMEVALDDE